MTDLIFDYTHTSRLRADYSKAVAETRQLKTDLKQQQKKTIEELVPKV